MSIAIWLVHVVDNIMHFWLWDIYKNLIIWNILQTLYIVYHRLANFGIVCSLEDRCVCCFVQLLQP